MSKARNFPVAALRKRRIPTLSAKSITAGLSLVSALMIASAILAPFLANLRLTVRDRVSKADVIVVLGGDGPARAEWGAELWLQGAAPRVLISGDGDCYWIRRAMVDRGVDANVITVECQSGTTWENALFSAPLLKHMNVRTAILVTSWYHSRRALASFAATSADIRWISVPVEPNKALWRMALRIDGIQLLKEYPKTVWYALRRHLGIDSTFVPPQFPSRELRA